MKYGKPHSASVLIFPVSSLIGIFFVIISCVEFSFWIANGIWIDCIPSGKWMKNNYNLNVNFATISSPSSTETWSCPDCIQLCNRFWGKFVKLSSKSFWLSSIFSFIFWFCVCTNKCCLLSSSKFLNEVIGGGCVCCCCAIFCAGVKKFSSFDDSSHDSSVDVMSSWNESWWF